MSTKVLKDGTVITFDETAQAIKVLRQTSILIKQDKIEAIAETFEDLDVPVDAEIIDVQGKIISPGFVNTHCHMWQTAFRTAAPNVSLVHYFDWLSQLGKTAMEAFTPDDVYISSLEGYLEGLNGGVTSFVDHAHHSWGIAAMEPGFNAIVDSGARSWWCYEPWVRQDCSIEEQWKEYERIAQKPRHSLVLHGLGYNGLAGASAEEFHNIRGRIKDLNIEAITLHHLGGPWPSHNSAPSEVAQNGLADLSVPVVLSHAGYLTKDDMKSMREKNIHVSITPESEFHYGHGQTTGHLISDQASLGIDTNFTFAGDILTQARMWLQKVRDTGFQQHLKNTGLLPGNTPMTVEQGFLLATRQGGRALWRDDIGVLKVGAKADIVVFNGDSPNMLGWNDAVAAVMLHANVGDIEHVLIDGHFRKRDGKLVNLKHDWADVSARFLETARRVQKHAAENIPPVAEKLWGMKDVGTLKEEYSTIRKI